MINNKIQETDNINISKERLAFLFLVVWVHSTELTIHMIERTLWKKVNYCKV